MIKMHSKVSKLLAALGIGLFLSLQTLAQNDTSYDLLFKQRNLPVKESQFRLPSNDTRLAEAPSSYRLIQFYELPSDVLRSSLEQNGVKLLDYVPNNAYFAYLKQSFSLSPAELSTYKIRAIIDIPNDVKLEKSLTLGTYPAWCEKSPGKLDLVVIFFENYSKEDAKAMLQGRGIEIIDNGPMTGSFVVRLPKERLAELSAISQVQYIEPVEEEHVSENYTSRTLSRSSAINTNIKGGKKYNGAGVTVSEGDTGDTGWHIDFTGRVTRMTSTYAAHSSHVCGIIGGAGNLDPKTEGAAAGARILSYTQYNDISAIPTIYNSQGVRITTHSLGTGSTCAGDYTSAAVTADQQSNTYTSLLHCFSAGNSGTSTCSAYAPYSTITGGSKSGKNVITVGNLSETDGISSSSSRGPTLDGRIKPDICAKGSNVYSTQDGNTYTTMSGTSMATPAVAGTLAELYQAFRSLNSGADPNNALMKAILLNSAEDLGTVGPDFTYGFGRINAMKAYNLIEKKQHQTNSIANGGTNTHTVSVPAGVGQLKVMLYWSDRAATAGVAKALVNDLDFTMTVPSGTVYQPWVLNSTLNSTTLPNAATRGADHLNNVEQITLDAPAAGTYTFTVKGYQIPTGSQSYYLVYEYVNDDITVTHPIGGEMLVPGETELIRWDAYGTSGTFTVEYSADGQSWSTLSSSVAGSRRYYSWTVPTTATSKSRIRVSRSGKSDISDENFCVINTPKSLAIANICASFTRLSWAAVTGASRYEVSKLGSTYMDSVGTTTNLFFDIPVGTTNQEWFSVRAVFADGIKGRRAIAISRAANPTLSCSVNALPVVTITAPVNNATFSAPATINIAATASDVDGTVSKVEFYNGATKLGEDVSSPYTYSWTNVAAGTYSITARATDNSGGVTTSTVTTIIVSANVLPTISITAPTNNTIYTTAPATVAITATANDSDGTISKVEFYNGATKLGEDASSPYTYSWTSVAAGTYTITAKATDNSGGVTTSSAITIKVNASPAVAITAPANNATYTAPATVAITATATDSDGSIAKVEFYNGATLLGTSTASPYTYNWTSVAVGTYTITAKATDNSGAVTTSAAVIVKVNAANVLPTVSITAPANNATYTAPATVAITATATDSDGSIAKVEFYNGATLLGTSTASPYTYSWTNVAVGTYTITAKATDNLGGVTTSSAITVKVNAANVLPTVSITAPVNNATYTAPATVAITATATDSDGSIAKVEFYNGATLLGTVTASPYTYNWTSVAVGTYTITAKATDNSGGATTSSAITIKVNAANVLPTVSITAPANNATYTAPATVAITATATDSDGSIAKVEFYNGATLLGTVTASPYTYSWASVAVGTYTITAKATDNSGGATTSSAITVKVNAANVLPTVSITAPANNATYTAPATVAISATATDSDGSIAKVEFYNGATLLGTATASPYTYNWPGVAAGSYSLTAKAYDNSTGVANSAAVTIVVNPAPSGTENCVNVSPWNSTSIYVNGDFVTHNNIKYKAKWWTTGNNPATTSGQYDVWLKLGECISGTAPAASASISMTPESQTILSVSETLSMNVSGLTSGTASEVSYILYKDTVRVIAIQKAGIDFSASWLASATGDYLLQVVVKDNNGRQIFADSKVVKVTQATHVNDLTEANLLTLYPNPTTGLVTFSEKVTSVLIYDLSGKVLGSHSLNSIKQLDLSGYAAGTYLVQLQSENNSKFEKVVKE